MSFHVRAVITGIMFGRINQNVLHFTKDVGIWPADGTALAAELETGFLGGASGLQQRVTTLQKWTQIDVYNLSLPGGAAVTRPLNMTGAKVGNQTQSFAQVCIVVNKLSFANGRHGRGRMYFSGVDPSTWNSGVMSSLEQSNWNNTLGQWVSRYVGPPPSSGWTMMINPKNETGDGGHLVQLLTLRAGSGSQRQRNFAVH